MMSVDRRGFLMALGLAPGVSLHGDAGAEAVAAHVGYAVDEGSLFQALRNLPPEGGTVYIDGDIPISRPIELQAGQRLIGFGPGVPVANQHPHPELDRIRRVPSGLRPADGVTLEWVVRIVGPAAGKQIWSACLENLSIENPSGGGVLIENAKDILLKECGLCRCAVGVKLIGARCYNVRILGCIMQANREHAVWIAVDREGKGADKIHVTGGDFQSHHGSSVFRIDGGQCHSFRDFQTGVSLPQAQKGQIFIVFALSGNAQGILIDSVYSENILQPIVNVADGANAGSLVIQNLVVHGVLPECPGVLLLGESRHIHVVGGYVRKWREDTPTVVGGHDLDIRGLVIHPGGG